MIVTRAKDPAPVEMRKVYAQTMCELAAEDERVVALDADLSSPIGMGTFIKQYPGRMINCGIQEANMAGVAAGMSARGCIPFAHTFACFQSRKCIDQIFLSAGFAGLNVKYIGSDPGILALYNGASHMALEDMGILSNVPGMVLVEPTDATMLRWLVQTAKQTYGNFYIRMNRKNADTIYDESTHFTLGKGIVLEDGTDVTIIAAGIMVNEALKAAGLLAQQGVSARVIDMFTWKPLDEDLIIESARKTGAIVTAENHRITTGLGSAVANILSEQCPVPLVKIGVQDSYGEVGTQSYLMERFHLRAADIADAALRAIVRKDK